MSELLFPYSYAGQLITLTQQRLKNTFKYLHPEVQRRFEGLQICVAVEEGVQIGVGTGQRVQLAGQANHASPGNSHHEDFPTSENPPLVPEHGAVAIDVVGSPTHEEGWTAMEKHLRQFGFTSFVIPSIRANWSTYMNRAYTGSWDRPHIQPTEIPYSRNFRTTPYTLKHWALPPEYDPDLIDVENYFSGGDNPTEHPEEDDMTPAQEQMLTAVYNGLVSLQSVLYADADGNGQTDPNTVLGRLIHIEQNTNESTDILRQLKP